MRARPPKSMAKSKIHSSVAARRQQSSAMKVLAYVFGSVVFLGIAYINIQSESQISKSSESQEVGQIRNVRTEGASGVSKGGDTSILVELQNMRESKPRNDSWLDPVLSYRGEIWPSSTNMPIHITPRLLYQTLF